MSIEGFAYPATVKEAVNILGSVDNPAVVIAGGTALTQQKMHQPTLLVDITRCGLDEIRLDSDRIHLGASVRVAQLASARLPGPAGALLQSAAQGIATQPLRNAITVGGNLMHLVYWSDLPVALLALDTTVHVAQLQRGEFDIPIAEFVAQHPKKLLPAGSLVTGVSIALAKTGADIEAKTGTGCCYRRFRTSATDYSLASVAAVVGNSDNRCDHIAVAIGAVGPRPVRLPQVEETLLGQTLSSRRIADAAQKMASQVKVAPNYRMSPEVRARILQVEIRRAISAAIA